LLFAFTKIPIHHLIAKYLMEHTFYITTKKFLVLMIAAAAMALADCSKDDETSSNVYEDENAPLYAASKKVWVLECR
jgi:hypothetical protein